jgi:hypothetical protein
MAISHKARYCNGFPHFVSNTDVLEPSLNSMLILSFRSIPVLSGHKSGHILFIAYSAPNEPTEVPKANWVVGVLIGSTQWTSAQLVS